MQFNNIARVVIPFLVGLWLSFAVFSQYTWEILIALQQPLPPTRITWFVEYPEVVLHVVQPSQTMNVTYEARFDVYTRLSFLDADQRMTSCFDLNLRTNAITKSSGYYLFPNPHEIPKVVPSYPLYLICNVVLGALIGLIIHLL